MLGRPVPKGLSIHFTDPFKPSSLGQWPSRGAPTAGCWPEARTTPSPSPGAGQAGCPHAPQWLGSTFMCTSSAERLLTQQLRELGRPVQPAGCGWAVPKLGSSARNQGPAQMCVCVGGWTRLWRAKLGVSGNRILVSLFLPGKPVPGPQAGLVALGPADYRCHCSGSCFKEAPPSHPWQAPSPAD